MSVDISDRVPDGFAGSGGAMVPFEDIHIGDKIGGGAFSTVHKGTFRGNEVAIKVVQAQQDLSKYLEAELAILGGVHHRNLMKYYGACVKDKKIYVITELLKSGDLSSIVSKRGLSLSWPRKLAIARDVIAGIAYLHSREIIHRDIKTENVLVDEVWRAVVCDYGFARRKTTAANMTICGTDEFMAPELLFGEPYDDKADIFSYGVVLAQLLTQQVPGMDGFLERHPREKFAINFDTLRTFCPAGTPPALWDLVVQCLGYEPSERPDADAVLAALDELCAAHPLGEEDQGGVPAVSEEAAPADDAPVEDSEGVAVQDIPVEVTEEVVPEPAEIAPPEVVAPAPAAVVEVSAAPQPTAPVDVQPAPAAVVEVSAAPQPIAPVDVTRAPADVAPEPAAAVVAAPPVLAEARPADDIPALASAVASDAVASVLQHSNASAVVAPAPTPAAPVAQAVDAPAVVAAVAPSPAVVSPPLTPAPAPAEATHSHSHGGHGHSHGSHGHSHGGKKKCVVQ